MTEVISPDHNINEAWKTVSTNIGTGIDELVRDFFSDLLVKNGKGNWEHTQKGGMLTTIYHNVNKHDMDTFLGQLAGLKQDFQQRGLTVVARDIVARGKIRVNQNGTVKDLPVSGTLDLLAYDTDGNFYIYDMKTHRGNPSNITK